MFRSTFVAVGLLTFLTFVLSTQYAAAQGGVSSASYSMARSGLPIQPNSVLIEEFFNYHRHRIAEPMGEAVALDVRWGAPACGPHTDAVLQVGLASTRHRIHSEKIPPLNLALVIDQSGSMQGERIEKVKQALLAFLGKLRPGDRVSIVGFSTEAQVLLRSQVPLVSKELEDAVSAITADGGTNLHAGLMLGYEEVANNFDAKMTNRVILLTDGQANHGVTDSAEIIEQSKDFNARDIDLSAIGVGYSFNHALMRELTDAGRGLLHFVGDEEDIQKTFVEELESLLAPVARRVSVVIEYDPSLKLVHVRGYSPSLEEGKITVPLHDLNHGATQVILARFQAAPELDAGELGVHVSLRYRDVASREAAEHQMTSTITYDPKLDADAPTLTDTSVCKNETIAAMAQGIKDLARVIMKTNDPAAASAVLAGPLALVDQRYPDLKDPDIQRVRDTLTNYRDLLGKEAKRKAEFEREKAKNRLAVP